MYAGEYLFKSQKGNNRPITTSQAYRIIVNAGNNIGLTEIGTHTMRKTFGYHHYQQYHDIAPVSYTHLFLYYNIQFYNRRL